MPRPNQCAYAEQGRRCVRNASGRSPFCRAHEVIARDAARSTEERGGFIAAATDVIQDVLSGRGLRRDKVAKAINEGIWEIGGGYSQFRPDLEDVDFTETATGGQQRARASRPAGARPPPSWFREESRPPPEPPEVAERRRAVAKARQVMGFGPGDKLTTEVLRARHRELAKKHHPDRGGSVTRMQEINAAVDVLSQDLASP